MVSLKWSWFLYPFKIFENEKFYHRKDLSSPRCSTKTFSQHFWQSARSGRKKQPFLVMPFFFLSKWILCFFLLDLEYTIDYTTPTPGGGHDVSGSTPILMIHGLADSLLSFKLKMVPALQTMMQTPRKIIVIWKIFLFINFLFFFPVLSRNVKISGVFLHSTKINCFSSKLFRHEKFRADQNMQSHSKNSTLRAYPALLLYDWAATAAADGKHHG